MNRCPLIRGGVASGDHRRRGIFKTPVRHGEITKEKRKPNPKANAEFWQKLREQTAQRKSSGARATRKNARAEDGDHIAFEWGSGGVGAPRPDGGAAGTSARQQPSGRQQLNSRQHDLWQKS